MPRTQPERLLCPSALPEMPDGRVFGLVEGSPEEPRVSYLDQTAPFTPDLAALAHPVKPVEIFRLAAPCVETKCCHFDGRDCRLATRIVQILPAVSGSLPACQVRAECRWFQQEGRAACMRCPQVVTLNCAASEEMTRAAARA